MAELDTSIPMSYKYGPSPVEQMGQVMTLADLMQQRKMRQMQMDEYSRQQYQAQQARKADLDLGKQVAEAAISKRIVPSTPAIQATGSLTTLAPIQESVGLTNSIQPTLQPTLEPTENIDPNVSQTLSGIKFPEYMSQISSFKGPSSLLSQRPKDLPPLTAEPITPVASGTIDQSQVTPPVTQQSMPESMPPTQPGQASVPEALSVEKNPLDLDDDEQSQVLNIFSKYGYAKGMELKDKMINSKKMRLEADNMILQGEKLKAEAFKLRNISDMYGKTPTGLDLARAQDPVYVQKVLADIQNRYDNNLIDESQYKALSFTANIRPVSVYEELKLAMAEKLKRPLTDAELTNKQKEAQLKGKELELKEKELETKTRDEEKKSTDELEAIQVGKAQTEDSINEINALVSNFSSGKVSTGMFANWIAERYTSGNSAAAKTVFDNIKANLTLKRLTDLKAAGGTLGALSEGEGRMLAAAASRLRFEGDVQSNITELKRIASIYDAARLRYEAKEARKTGQPAIKPKDVPLTSDAKAVKWAKDNPTDPRAIKILQIHGVK